MSSHFLVGLTNPRIRDHPIVLVSEGFTRVTGYEKHQIVGRNCRFLQGPGTAPQSVQRIRDGLNYGEGCTELLLNYRRDGTPFYCLSELGASISPNGGGNNGNQLLVGAEANLNTPRSLDDQMKLFEATYSNQKRYS